MPGAPSLPCPLSIRPINPSTLEQYIPNSYLNKVYYVMEKIECIALTLFPLIALASSPPLYAFGFVGRVLFKRQVSEITKNIQSFWNKQDRILRFPLALIGGSITVAVTLPLAILLSGSFTADRLDREK